MGWSEKLNYLSVKWKIDNGDLDKRRFGFFEIIFDKKSRCITMVFGGIRRNIYLEKKPNSVEMSIN